MTEENVLRMPAQQEAYDAMQKAVREYNESRDKKSFSERHPELGKMVNCGVCGLRHRSARTCVPSYTTTMKDADGVEQPAGLVRVPELGQPIQARVALGWGHGRGRILKHRNKRSLQVLERATKIYNENLLFLFNPTQEDRDKLGKQSLSRAINELRKERAARRRKFLVITKRSRRINRDA